MRLAVLIPVKAFSAAKRRLADVLDGRSRAQLAEWMADRVVDASSGTPVFIACDDDHVRRWAESRDLGVLWGPGLGLNGAVDDGVAELAARGFDQVVVSHADLPLARGISAVATPGRVTLIPDRARDGTNVMSFPCQHPIPASYGAGSFRRHLGHALDREVEVRIDAELSLDVDTPADLTRPLLREVLPPWLPTIPANHHNR